MTTTADLKLTVVDRTDSVGAVVLTGGPEHQRHVPSTTGALARRPGS